MKKTFLVLTAIGFAAATLATHESANAQVVITVAPPAPYIATTEPVYYEGRPTYWYGNRWYYRDRGAWQSYANEPPYLIEHRQHAPPVRHYYHHAWHGGHGGGHRR